MSTYEVNGVQYPSVTTVLDQLDKSNALIPWAINMMGNRVLGEVFVSDKKEFSVENISNFIEIGKKEYRNVSNEAMDIGTEVHDKIKDYIHGGKDSIGDMRPEVENAMIGFFEWESKNIDKWLESEKKVYHREFCYAGTLDAIAVMKDGVTRLIDFKTSKGFYDGYAEQLAAYFQARSNIKFEEEDTVIFKHKVYDGEMAEFEVSYDNSINLEGMGILRLDKITGLPEFKNYDKGFDRKRKCFNSLLDCYYHQKKRRLKNNPRVY